MESEMFDPMVGKIGLSMLFREMICVRLNWFPDRYRSAPFVHVVD